MNTFCLRALTTKETIVFGVISHQLRVVPFLFSFKFSFPLKRKRELKITRLLSGRVIFWTGLVSYDVFAFILHRMENGKN